MGPRGWLGRVGGQRLLTKGPPHRGVGSDALSRFFSTFFSKKKEITPVRTFRRFSAFPDLSIGRDAEILECVGQRLNERKHIITGDVDGVHVIHCMFAGGWFTPKGEIHPLSGSKLHHLSTTPIWKQPHCIKYGGLDLNAH